jgi:outer membrane protein OmpA-like peptidoglycan-associated protein
LDNSSRWLNNSWSDYDSYVDTFGNLHFDMDFDFEFDWDWDADADIDTDVDGYGEGYSQYDNRFDNRFDNSYYNRYYNGNYGRYAPYNYYYNYQYGYNYPAAQQASTAPAPAPQPPAAAEPAKVDVEPATPVKPISVDDDKDQVLNSSDFCPNTAEGAQVDAFGCAIDEVIVLRGVNFHTDSDNLTDESTVILDGVSTTLNAHPELKLEVSGHTDSDAEDDYNKHLSQRRAERVREYLINKGAAADNLTAKGYGEERPIASNDTAEGKSLNRRVELNRL